MTNLKLKIEELLPIADLIEKLNGDEGRIIVGDTFFNEKGMVMYVRDKYKNNAIRVSFSESEVIDIVDEYKPLNGGEFYWLRFKATDTQKTKIFNRMLDLLIFKANEISEAQLQYA